MELIYYIRNAEVALIKGFTGLSGISLCSHMQKFGVFFFHREKNLHDYTIPLTSIL